MSDGFVLGWSLLFAAWVVFGLGGRRLAPLMDFVLFGVIGVMAGSLQWRVASRIEQPREQLAWRLLAAASFSRFVSGSVWGLVAELGGVRQDPPWLIALASAYLVFGIASMLAFPSARWQQADRVRFRLDAAMVLIGSGLVVWFFAIGPYLRAPAQAPFGVQVYTIGDSLTVFLAAALYLRSTSTATRRAAGFLLVAFSLHVVPDIGFWRGGWATRYSAGDPIAGIWFCVWLLKWMAARSAQDALDHPERGAEPGAARYGSGIIPHAFLMAATGLLLFKLVSGDHEDLAPFALASAVLASLLVARQGVELRERDRLHGALRAEEARYRALLHHAYDAVLVIDRMGEVRYASPATERLLGRGVSSSDARTMAAAVHPADRDLVRAAFRAARTSPQTLTVRVRDQAGEWRMLEGHLQDRRDDMLIGAFVINGLDRTREHRLEQGLLDAQEFEALGTLASGLAHDLNNILTVIASHTELLRDDVAVGSAGRADLRAIRAASDRAQALTQGLLALSRRKSAAWTLVAIDPLVRARIAARPGESIRVIADPAASASVRADARALAQVIDAALDEFGSGVAKAGASVIRIEERTLDAATARALHVEPGSYVVIAVGEPLAGAPVRTEDAVKTADEGEWDLAPGDLAMLMALAAARELGGTLVRERSAAAACLSVYLPSEAA